VAAQISEILQHLRAAIRPDGPDTADGQLLECYIGSRDEAAFAALVRRHGPMVWGVCRRVLDNQHDVEDAFQATFLVLVRKAASVVPRAMVANWLYGVAYQTALNVKALHTKRKARERQVQEMPEPEVVHQDRDRWDDLRPLLDQELSRLPDKYRTPIVLCDLEGKTRKEAARQLGWPEGTVAGRLARARAMLAERLARRGVVLSGVALAVALSRNAASAGVPPSVVSSTIEAASRLAAGQAAACVVSANVVAITEGVLKAMFLTKLKVATAVVVAVGVLLGAGVGLLTQRAQAEKPTDKVAAGEAKVATAEVSGVVKAVDAARSTITLHPSKASPEEMTFAIARGVKVFLDDGTGDKLGFEEGTPADLTEGVSVTLRVTDRKEVVRAWVEGPTVQGTLKAVDAANDTITATVAMSKTEPAADKTFAVAKTARLFIDDGQAPDKSQPAKVPTLADLPPNAQVSLKLSADRKVVGAIRAEGRSIHGTVKAIDAAKNTITIAEKEGEQTFDVMKDPVIILDGRIDKNEPKKLADVPVDAVVDVKLLTDQKTVRHISAYGPTVIGSVAGTGKDSITIGTKEGELSFTLAKDVQIVIDASRAGKLAELIDGTIAQLRLSADKSAVLEIRAEGPSFHGTVKALDADKSTITLTIGAKNGEGGEDKEFKLSKATVVVTEINGVPLKVTDLKADKEVVLRLAIDQKAAARITVLGE
jgi:RNA polymerase sigma factor (sigma-70 family)